MKVLDLTFPDPPLRIVEAVHFDPWPFTATMIEVKNARYIAPDGVLSEVHDTRIMRPAMFDVLCRMSDGTLATAHIVGVGEHTNQGRS